MAISLTAKAEKIGFATAVKLPSCSRSAKIVLKSFTEVESKLVGLQSKLDGWKEGGCRFARIAGQSSQFDA